MAKRPQKCSCLLASIFLWLKLRGTPCSRFNSRIKTTWWDLVSSQVWRSNLWQYLKCRSWPSCKRCCKCRCSYYRIWKCGSSCCRSWSIKALICVQGYWVIYGEIQSSNCRPSLKTWLQDIRVYRVGSWSWIPHWAFISVKHPCSKENLETSWCNCRLSKCLLWKDRCRVHTYSWKRNMWLDSS